MISIFPTSVKDFLTEVKRGNVPGMSLDAVVCRNPAIGSSFEDCWGEGGTMIQPTGAESYELVSDNANDTLAGTGMRSVLVQTRDATGLTVLQTVNMNGTTPVALTGTHTYPAGLFGLTADQTLTGKNIGTIKLQVAGGGAVRNVMLPTISRSHDTHYRVASNQTAKILTTQVFPPKSGRGTFRNEFKTSGADDAWQTGSLLSFFEGAIQVKFESRPELPSGSDLRLRLESDTGGALDITVIFELLLIEN